MTAGELIKILKRVPKDAKVQIKNWKDIEVSLKRSSEGNWTVNLEWTIRDDDSEEKSL